MRTVVRIGSLDLGGAKPALCAPLVAADRASLVDLALIVPRASVDLVEWRVDHLERGTDPAVRSEALAGLRDVLPTMPLLATFRTAGEGGAVGTSTSTSTDDYLETVKSLVSTYGRVANAGRADLAETEAETRGRGIDAIDIELSAGDTAVREIVRLAAEHEVTVVCSQHHWQRTPPCTEIVAALARMRALGADIVKVAVMPQSPDDVVELLAATVEANRAIPDAPIVTMAMGPLGVATRIVGETFGSAMTFAALGKSSAPGQLPLTEARAMIDALHSAGASDPS